jgi:hypothetical protein
MTKRNVLSLIIGFLLSLIFSAVVYYYLLLETIDLFDYDSLKNPELRHAKIFYTSLVATLTILIAAGLLRKFKFFSTGLAIPAVIGLFPLISVGPTYISKSAYYEDFDQEKWMHDDDRIKMARELLKSRALFGLSRKEIVAKLGAGHESGQEINYKIYGHDCLLWVRFTNDTVRYAGIEVRD